MQEDFEQDQPGNQREMTSGASGASPNVTRMEHDAGRNTAPRNFADRNTTRACVGSALKFVGRFAQMDIESLGVSIRTWHRLADKRWFQAEAAVAEAIEATSRYREQEMLLEKIAEVFRRASWFRRSEPGAGVGASEPSSQYVGTLAMLALLVRDRIDPDHFNILYQPFVQFIPERDLGPE